MDNDDLQRRRLNVRVEPELHERVRLIAEERFGGVHALVMRDALETYVDLRDALGYDFDRTISELLKREAVAA